jgi:hypothetical protein
MISVDHCITWMFSAILSILFVTMVCLYVRTLVEEEYYLLLNRHVHKTYSREWALDNLQTGDIVTTFASRFENDNFFQAHCVTHSAIVVRLNPNQVYENLLVFEVRKRYRRSRDMEFITLERFFELYAGSAESILARRLETPLNTDLFMQAAMEMSSCVFDSRVQIQQINEWAKTTWLVPFLPQTRAPSNAVYCSTAIASILTNLGVFDPRANQDQSILAPIEFVIPPSMSSRELPLESALLSPHKWLPLARIVQSESLRIGAAEQRGDLSAARRIRKQVQRANKTKRKLAKREHKARANGLMMFAL